MSSLILSVLGRELAALLQPSLLAPGALAASLQQLSRRALTTQAARGAEPGNVQQQTLSAAIANSTSSTNGKNSSNGSQADSVKGGQQQQPQQRHQSQMEQKIKETIAKQFPQERSVEDFVRSSVATSIATSYILKRGHFSRDVGETDAVGQIKINLHKMVSVVGQLWANRHEQLHPNTRKGINQEIVRKALLSHPAFTIIRQVSEAPAPDAAASATASQTTALLSVDMQALGLHYPRMGNKQDGVKEGKEVGQQQAAANTESKGHEKGVHASAMSTAHGRQTGQPDKQVVQQQQHGADSQPDKQIGQPKRKRDVVQEPEGAEKRPRAAAAAAATVSSIAAPPTAATTTSTTTTSTATAAPATSAPPRAVPAPLPAWLSPSASALQVQAEIQRRLPELQSKLDVLLPPSSSKTSFMRNALARLVLQQAAAASWRYGGSISHGIMPSLYQGDPCLPSKTAAALLDKALKVSRWATVAACPPPQPKLLTQPQQQEGEAAAAAAAAAAPPPPAKPTRPLTHTNLVELLKDDPFMELELVTAPRVGHIVRLRLKALVDLPSAPLTILSSAAKKQQLSQVAQTPLLPVSATAIALGLSEEAVRDYARSKAKLQGGSTPAASDQALAQHCVRLVEMAARGDDQWRGVLPHALEQAKLDEPSIETCTMVLEFPTLNMQRLRSEGGAKDEGAAQAEAQAAGVAGSGLESSGSTSSSSTTTSVGSAQEEAAACQARPITAASVQVPLSAATSTSSSTASSKDSSTASSSAASTAASKDSSSPSAGSVSPLPSPPPSPQAATATDSSSGKMAGAATSPVAGTPAVEPLISNLSDVVTDDDEDDEDDDAVAAAAAAASPNTWHPCQTVHITQVGLAFEGMMRHLRAVKHFAIDTEFTFKVVLMQLCAPAVPSLNMPKKVYIVDPMAWARSSDRIRAMQRLGALLEDPNRIKVLHAVQMDKIMLERSFAIKLRGYADTQQLYNLVQLAQEERRLPGAATRGMLAAARSISLAHMMQAYGVHHNMKAEFKLEYKKDRKFWERRPLTADMIEYARADVEHLVPIYRNLLRRLLEAEPNFLFGGVPEMGQGQKR